MAYISINGTALARPPMTVTPSYNDLSSENSGRNAAGEMLKDRIATKVKLELEWSGLTASQAASILTAILTDIFFSVTYQDPKTNANRTITCYAGDPQLEVAYIDPITNKPFYRSMKISLIQK